MSKPLFSIVVGAAAAGCFFAAFIDARESSLKTDLKACDIQSDNCSRDCDVHIPAQDVYGRQECHKRCDDQKRECDDEAYRRERDRQKIRAGKTGPLDVGKPNDGKVQATPTPRPGAHDTGPTNKGVNDAPSMRKRGSLDQSLGTSGSPGTLAKTTPSPSPKKKDKNKH